MHRRRSTEISRESPPPSAAEWILLATILLAAVALRCAFPSRMAVEHFDEGVYASNLWFPETGYPARYLYAPPLFPWLVEWAMVFFGTGHWGTMLVNIAFGSLTVLLVWCVARRWFGPAAGLSAAVLAATSDFHLLYSRTVLTDVSLCFWLLLAVFFFGETFRRGSYVWAIAAGVATGLAWSTKYNGWLPLAVGIAGLAGWAAFHRPGWQAVWRNFLLWGTAAVTAAVVWIPAWNSLPHGYAEVAANHQQYLVGFDQWGSTFLRQAANLRYLDGWLSATGIAVAVLMPTLLRWGEGDRFTWNAGGVESRESRVKSENSGQVPPMSTPLRSGRVLFEVTLVLAVLVVVIAVASGSVVVLAVLAVVEFCRRTIASRNQAAGASDSGNSLPTWLLAAWFIGMLVATPLYTPYPRLALPWLVAAWIAAGAAIAYWVDRTAGGCAPTVQSTVFRSLIAGALTVGIVGGAAWLAEQKSNRGVTGWQDRSLLEQGAQRVFTAVRRSAEFRHAVIGVYAQPALVFHLNSLGANDSSLEIIAHPIASLDAAKPQNVPTFLVVDRLQFYKISGYDEFIRRRIDSQTVELPHLLYVRYRQSNLVLLNQFDARELPTTDPSSRVMLWRVLPDGSSLLRPPRDGTESFVEEIMLE